MNEHLSPAIRKLRPGSEFTYTNDDYLTIEWIKLNGEAPTLAEVEEAIEIVKLEEAEAIEAARAKRAELLNRLGITEEEAKLLAANL